MSHFNYGGRIGLSSLILFVKKACRLYIMNRIAIKNYINGSSTLSVEQKATVITWLDAIEASCEILMLIEVIYER